METLGANKTCTSTPYRLYAQRIVLATRDRPFAQVRRAVAGTQVRYANAHVEVQKSIPWCRRSGAARLALRRAATVICGPIAVVSAGAIKWANNGCRTVGHECKMQDEVAPGRSRTTRALSAPTFLHILEGKRPSHSSGKEELKRILEDGWLDSAPETTEKRCNVIRHQVRQAENMHTRLVHRYMPHDKPETSESLSPIDAKMNGQTSEIDPCKGTYIGGVVHSEVSSFWLHEIGGDATRGVGRWQTFGAEARCVIQYTLRSASRLNGCSCDTFLDESPTTNCKINTQALSHCHMGHRTEEEICFVNHILALSGDGVPCSLFDLHYIAKCYLILTIEKS
ncbi:hypothetical protein PR048_027930 [Dryococelus australis]|uniref:Uncharacterized protein n=1 Tax=Dryococelus australis TaxID=614101 RepID=A0ABQ9GHU4_9NEOP|nr:hypothetical protein PR048_027930 [Dryococelus australis]